MEQKLTTLHKQDKSWIITWVSIVITLLAIISFATIVEASSTQSFDAGPTFRIVEVRSEQGQLAVEVQHFNPDGSHWFYEMYNWAGELEFSRDISKNSSGNWLLEDGTEAPFSPIDPESHYEVLEGSGQYRPSYFIQFEERVVNTDSGRTDRLATYISNNTGGSTSL